MQGCAPFAPPGAFTSRTFEAKVLLTSVPGTHGFARKGPLSVDPLISPEMRARPPGAFVGQSVLSDPQLSGGSVGGPFARPAGGAAGLPAGPRRGEF